jgi:hypothetical protein
MSDKQKSITGSEAVQKAATQFQKFDEQVKSLTVDEMAKAPLREEEQQTRMSTREANKVNEVYMKCMRSASSKEKFNEEYRKEWEEKKKYIKCIVENLEIIGERLEFWTKPFAGIPAEFWQIPVNTPVLIPKYVAEQISRKSYSRLVMDEQKTTTADGMGTYYGALAVKERRRRLDCRPVGFDFVSMAI